MPKELMSKELILKELEPLFKRAREQNLWFHCNYQDLWFTPEELEKTQEKGRFVWGAINWELKDPTEKLQGLQNKVKRAQKDYDEFQLKLYKCFIDKHLRRNNVLP